MEYINEFYGTIKYNSETEEFMNEWKLDEIYESDEPDHCICGHEIREVCIVKNKLNNNTLKIGNCCIKKFGFMVDGWSQSLLSGLKRIKKDSLKAMNKSLIEFCHKKKFINDWEYKFLTDTKRKRKLTPKQMNVRLKINNRIVGII